MRDSEGMPTLRECWEDVHSFKDLLEFLPLLVPTPIYRSWRAARHPIYYYRRVQHNRWCDSVRVGDWVCSCSGDHVQVEALEDRDTILASDGSRYSLAACCVPIEGDNSCHARS